MIIVTGGAGFIGSNIVAALESRGEDQIVVADWLGQDDKWKNIAKRDLYDLVAPENLADFMRRHADRIRGVIHMGAISATTERNADLILERNVTASWQLWSWCCDHQVPFIYASSAATYGDGAQGFNDDASRAGLAKLRPMNAYGWSKHWFDRLVAREIETGGKTPPHWAGLKFFNVYGVNETHKDDMRSVVCKLYPEIVRGEPARLFESHRPDFPHGGQSRDFIWVDDCVRVVLWLLDTASVSGLFNCGTGIARSFRDLASATFAAANIAENILYTPMPEHLRDRYQYFTRANMEKLRAAGYTAPFTSLEDGIRDYVQNYLSQSDSYR